MADLSTPHIFLKLVVKNAVVAGQASVTPYKGLIAIESLTWGVNAVHHPLQDPKKVRTESRPQRLQLNKYFDLATPNLCLYMRGRERFTTATVLLTAGATRGSDGRVLTVMEMQLEDGFIESVDLKASPGSKATSIRETVSLSYRGFKMLYYPPESGGGRLGPTTLDLSDVPSVSS